MSGDADGRAVLVLERVVPGQEPSYTAFGKATCVFCPEWVWLGSESFGLVSAGHCDPICQQCSVGVITPVTPLLGAVHDQGRVVDPRR